MVITMLLPPMPVMVMVVMMYRMSSTVAAALDGGRELGEGSLDLVPGTRRLRRRRRREVSVVVRLDIRV